MTKSEINKYKKQAKHYMEVAEAWRSYAISLESIKSDLIEELSQISQGFTFSDQPVGWSTQTKLENRAAKKIAHYAKREETNKPKGCFYI